VLLGAAFIQESGEYPITLLNCVHTWSMVTPRMLTLGARPLNVKGRWLECLLLVMAIAPYLCGVKVFPKRTPHALLTGSLGELNTEPGEIESGT